jgi:hypothetical protein
MPQARNGKGKGTADMCRLARNTLVLPYYAACCAKHKELYRSSNGFINPIHPSTLPLRTL